MCGERGSLVVATTVVVCSSPSCSVDALFGRLNFIGYGLFVQLLSVLARQTAGLNSSQYILHTLNILSLPVIMPGMEVGGGGGGPCVESKSAHVIFENESKVGEENQELCGQR